MNNRCVNTLRQAQGPMETSRAKIPSTSLESKGMTFHKFLQQGFGLKQHAAPQTMEFLGFWFYPFLHFLIFSKYNHQRDRTNLVGQYSLLPFSCLTGMCKYGFTNPHSNDETCTNPISLLFCAANPFCPRGIHE